MIADPPSHPPATVSRFWTRVECFVSHASPRCTHQNSPFEVSLSPFQQTAEGVSHFELSRQVQVVRREFGRMSDAELLRAGSADAFEEVYDRHAVQVLAWARARVGEHAADLTAEVFARAWLNKSRFRYANETSALPWLFGIAKNVLREALRN